MITIAIVVYVLSALLGWKHINLTHSKNGIWRNIDVTIVDVLFMILPVFNTFFALVGWINYYPIPKPKKNSNKKNYLNKFFNIK